MSVWELLDINMLNGVQTSEHLYSDFDFITLSNQGISKASVEALIGHIGMSKKDFAEDVLHISVKTLQRKKSDHKFDRYTSSHVIEIARVVEHTFEVFEDAGKVQRWLNTPNQALNNMKPLALFYTPTGLAMVDNILGRIEEGVYS